MKSMSKVAGLLDELGKLMKAEYPEYTSGSFQIDPDGYINITLLKWDKESTEGFEKTKRRSLLNISRVYGEWNNDTSESNNKYLEKLGLLLGGANR